MEDLTNRAQYRYPGQGVSSNEMRLIHHCEHFSFTSGKLAVINASIIITVEQWVFSRFGLSQIVCTQGYVCKHQLDSHFHLCSSTCNHWHQIVSVMGNRAGILCGGGRSSFSSSSCCHTIAVVLASTGM